MKLDINAANLLVADLHAAVRGGANDVPIERQVAHVALVKCLPALVEVALAAEQLTTCEGRDLFQQNYEILKSKLATLKELP